MEMYVYYSIIVFGIIISSLYLYIIVVKSFEKRNNIKKGEYESILIPLIDTIITDMMNGTPLNLLDKEALLKSLSKDKLRNRVAEDRIIYYLENFNGDFTAQLVYLCEEIGIIDLQIEALSQNNVYAKALACKKLGELKSKKAVPYLLKEVTSSSPDVTYNALLALAKIGDSEGFLKAFETVNASILLSERSLIEVADSFEGDKSTIYSKMIACDSEFVSCIFIKSAGSYKDDNLAHQIARFLKSDSKERVIAAAKALGTMNATAYISNISELLTNESWEIRAIAAKALGYYHDISVIDKLIGALSDRQWFVRYNAANSILALDKKLDYVVRVFKGDDKFAKDILISSMENNNMLTLILDDTDISHNFSEDAVLLIRSYILEDGGYKNV